MEDITYKPGYKMPTPTQIRQRAAAIRRTWAADEEYRRRCPGVRHDTPAPNPIPQYTLTELLGSYVGANVFREFDSNG